MVRSLVDLSAPVSRGSYRAVGFTLAALKLGFETGLLYAVTGRFWSPIELMLPLFAPRAPIYSQPTWLLWLLAVWTIPFIWVGASMTVRRAIDAGWNPWIGLIFFLPVLNYALILALCLAPTREGGVSDTPDSGPLIENAFRAAFVGVAGAVMLGIAMMCLQTYLLRSYGASVFFGIPVAMGALCGYVQNRGHLVSRGQTARSALVAVLLALEGAICIVMTLPLAFGMIAFGALMGRAIAQKFGAQTATWLMMLVVLPTSSGVEVWTGRSPEFQVVSSIEVDAPPEHVWPSVVGFSPIPPPSEWLFKTGIAYPVRATIEGEGVGAVRHCEFTTGAFVEPVTRWEPPSRLSFDVESQPPPMNAYSGNADQRVRAKAITDSGACRSPDDAGWDYFACFLPLVKASAFRMESPPSLSRWALWTRRSQIASARVASPMTECQSLGSS